MNLNTLLRHGVLDSCSTLRVEDSRHGVSYNNMVDYVAGRIADESEIRRGKQFPYQYFAAYLNVDELSHSNFINGSE